MAMDDKVSEYLTIMMCHQCVYGFNNDRWAKYLDVMIEKESGIWKIQQLHIICLVEADFNIALEIFFIKHFVMHSECTNLTKEKMGGCTGWTVTDATLRKMLAFEYGHIMYVAIATFMMGCHPRSRSVPRNSITDSCPSSGFFCYKSR